MVRGKHYISCIKVANTNREIIEWFHQSYGGYFYTRRFTDGKSKDAYTWTLTDKKVVPFLQKITPYLRIKKKQGELILRREKLKDRVDNLGHRKGMIYPSGILEEIKRCHDECKLLNKRGKPVHAERLTKETPEMEK